MRAAELRELISKTESDLARLKAGLARVEAVGEKAKSEADDAEVDGWKWPLRAQEYDRYGRQLILPNFGIHGEFFDFFFSLFSPTKLVPLLPPPPR